MEAKASVGCPSYSHWYQQLNVFHMKFIWEEKVLVEEVREAVLYPNSLSFFLAPDAQAKLELTGSNKTQILTDEVPW